MRKYPCILSLLLLTGCGYVLHEGPIQFAHAPKWRGEDAEFFVFDTWPTNHFKVVCDFLAVSDVGDYPDDKKRCAIALRYAKRYGGNGVVLQQGAFGSTNDFRVFHLIYVEKRD